MTLDFHTAKVARALTQPKKNV